MDTHDNIKQSESTWATSPTKEEDEEGRTEHQTDPSEVTDATAKSGKKITMRSEKRDKMKDRLKNKNQRGNKKNTKQMTNKARNPYVLWKQENFPRTKYNKDIGRKWKILPNTEKTKICK